MLYDFDKIEEVKVENFKGGEKYIWVKTAVDDGMMKFMQTRVVPGASIGMHTHDENCEVIRVLSGGGKSILDGVEERLVPGLVQYCAKGHEHCIINDTDEDLVLFAIVPATG